MKLLGIKDENIRIMYYIILYNNIKKRRYLECLIWDIKLKIKGNKDSLSSETSFKYLNIIK